jgi:hypothetical protein
MMRIWTFRRGSDQGQDYSNLLQSARNALVRIVRDKLQKDPATDVSAELSRIEALEAGISAAPTSWLRDLLWSFAAALACVALILLLTKWRVSTVEFDFAIESRAVEVSAAEPWQVLSTPFVMRDAFTIRNAGQIDFRGALTKIGIVTAPSTLKVSGSNATLSVSTITKGSLVRFACLEDGSAELAITGGAVEAQITAGATMRVSGRGNIGGNTSPSKFDEPITSPQDSFILRSVENRPFVIRSRRADFGLTMAGPVDQISFPEDQAADPQLGQFRSAISGGKLTVTTIDTAYDVQPFDRLGTKGVSGNVLITPTDECVEVRFVGSATQAELGKPPFMENLAPTQLAYVFREQALPFYLGIFSTLWAVIWGGLSWVRQRADGRRAP